MRAGPGNGAERRDRERDQPGAGEISDSFLAEVRAAADAAARHVRTVAATAAAEARLSVASAAALAAAAVAALAFVLVAWICLLALGIWLAVQAGAPLWGALAGAVVLNLAGVFACRVWIGRLIPNLSFARTRNLLGKAGG
jgi:hypothetical protein